MYELYYLVLSAETEEKQKLLFTVSIVDDDALFREAVKDYLVSMKIDDVECFASGEEFLSKLKEDDKRLVVCDFDFGSPQVMNGLQVLDEIKKRNPKMPVIMLSAQDKIAVALETLRKGAVDYFMKGSETTFTSVLTSILKVNELQRLKKNEKDYITTIIVGSIVSIVIIGLLLFKNNF